MVSGRLYSKAVFTGYKRGQRNQHEHTALLQVEGCAGKEDARCYPVIILPLLSYCCPVIDWCDHMSAPAEHWATLASVCRFTRPSL